MPVTEQTILDQLRRVILPGTEMSIVDAGRIHRVAIDKSSVTVEIAPSTPEVDSQVRAGVRAALAELDEVGEVTVTVLAPQPAAAPGADEPKLPGVRHVIAVASGKGGVGKSTVATNLALALAQAGYSVGLLDADIYGPSQQLMMTVDAEPKGTTDGKIEPLDGVGGVKVMSIGYIVDPDQPIIWRGPMLQKALEQFLGDVLWGELDVLVADLPPGTGDVAISLCQMVPIAGAVIVTTPQEVALVDARKGLGMFKRLDVPVLGIVENMSDYVCPACGHHEPIFGTGGGRRTADELRIPFLGSVPIDPAIVAGGDQGHPVVLARPDSPSARALRAVADEVAGRLKDRFTGGEV